MQINQYVFLLFFKIIFWPATCKSQAMKMLTFWISLNRSTLQNHQPSLISLFSNAYAEGQGVSGPCHRRLHMLWRTYSLGGSIAIRSNLTLGFTSFRTRVFLFMLRTSCHIFLKLISSISLLFKFLYTTRHYNGTGGPDTLF